MPATRFTARHVEELMDDRAYADRCFRLFRAASAGGTIDADGCRLLLPLLGELPDRLTKRAAEGTAIDNGVQRAARALATCAETAWTRHKDRQADADERGLIAAGLLEREAA